MERSKVLVAACSDLDLNLISSQPLMQGMCSTIPLSKEAIAGVYNLSARHLQLVRSIPTKCLKSTLVGMKQNEHIRSNLEVTQKPLMSREEFFTALAPHRRTPHIEQHLHL